MSVQSVDLIPMTLKYTECSVCLYIRYMFLVVNIHWFFWRLFTHNSVKTRLVTNNLQDYKKSNKKPVQSKIIEWRNHKIKMFWYHFCDENYKTKHFFSVIHNLNIIVTVCRYFIMHKNWIFIRNIQLIFFIFSF